MPRPRFDNLAAEKRTALLGAAAEEFATHGYEAASLNRIIEHAALSKGALYYYFDDKADLYQTVLTDALLRCHDYVGAMDEVTSADEFWNEIERLYRRAMSFYRIDANAVGLARGALTALATGRNLGPLAEHRAFVAAWFRDFVSLGRTLDAVRSDIPAELLISVAVHVAEAGDAWLVSQIDDLSDPQLEELAHTFVDFLRRLGAPDPSARRTSS